MLKNSKVLENVVSSVVTIITGKQMYKEEDLIIASHSSNPDLYLFGLHNS